jgi:hypothetical protein
MYWIEIGSQYPYEDLTWTPYDDDQTKFLPDALITEAQQETLTRITTTVDESACQAESCCSEPPRPLGCYLTGDDDHPVLDSFFLLTDGKAICEDCGIEILEQQQVVIPG